MLGLGLGLSSRGRPSRRGLGVQAGFIVFGLSLTLLLGGCKKPIHAVAPATSKAGAESLLQVRLLDLWPSQEAMETTAKAPKKPSKASKHKPPSASPRRLDRLDLSQATKLQIRMKKKDQTLFYEIMHAEDRWWVIRRTSRGETWIKPFASRALASKAFEIQGFVEERDDDLDADDAPFQVAFFQDDGRFLFRALYGSDALPSVDRSAPPLWIYAYGRLYRSPSVASSLSRWLRLLAREVATSPNQGVWIPLPSEVRDLPFLLALQMGERIERMRRRLLACFKSHSFSTNLGPLSVLATFQANGSLKSVSYPTNAHRGKNPFWCIHAGIKVWKIQESHLSAVSFPFAIPPQGPPPPLPPELLYKPKPKEGPSLPSKGAKPAKGAKPSKGAKPAKGASAKKPAGKGKVAVAAKKPAGKGKVAVAAKKPAGKGKGSAAKKLGSKGSVKAAKKPAGKGKAAPKKPKKKEPKPPRQGPSLRPALFSGDVQRI